MDRNTGNIYKTARLRKGITQETAAEALGISTDSVRSYENGYRVPPTDIVEMMCMLYDTPHLAAQHLREGSGLGAMLVPDVEGRTLQAGAIRLVNRVLAFADKHRDRDLLMIAEDGIIDEGERPLINEIVRELEEIRASATEVQLAAMQGRGGRTL